MTFLPIIERELRVAARRVATYRTRFFMALVALVIAAGLFLMLQSAAFFGGGWQWGKTIFSTLSGLALVFCLVEGVRQTSDCLSGEKREGTLGLLFLTDLKGYDVVLGKLVAAGLNTLYGMLAVFPLLSVALLMGGVTLGEYWRIVLALVNALFVSLCVGLWVSARGREESRVLFGGLLLMALLTLGVPWLEAMVRHWAGVGNEWLMSTAVNPAAPFGLAFDGSYLARSHWYWGSLLGTQLLSWGLLGHAAWRVRRRWQDGERQTTAKSRRWRRMWQGNDAFRGGQRRQMLETNPARWLAARRQMFLGWFGLGVGAVLAFYVWLFTEQDGLMQVSVLHSYLTKMVFFLAKVVAAWLACRFLIEARRTGALELWLTTPLSVKEIIRGQQKSFQRFWWACVYLGVAFPAIYLVHLWFLSWGTDELQGSTFMMVGMMAIQIPGQGAMDWTPIFGHVAAVTSVFLMDVLALSWVGMWLAMRSRSLNQALFKTFVWVIVIPWFVMTFVWMTLMFSGRFSPDQALLRTLAHAVPLLLKNVIFIGWARSQLLTRFREAAAESLPVRSPSACKESLPTPARKDCEEFSRDGQNFIPH